jgi:hypothetical protein
VGIVFDNLGWSYEYEPVDFGPWSPDFAITTHSGPLFVEVKPIPEGQMDLATIERMRLVPGEHLLVGLHPWWDDTRFAGRTIGYLTSKSWASSESPAKAELCLIEHEHPKRRTWGVRCGRVI